MNTKRPVFLALAAALAAAAGLEGCSTLHGFASNRLPGIPDPSARIPGMTGLSRGRISPRAAELIQAVGPAAVGAANAIAKALAEHAAEQREADLRAEESRRLHVAAVQSFYADQCTQKGPDGAQAGEGAPKGAEKEAEEAFAAGDYARAAGLLQGLYDAQKKRGNDRDPELARLANRLAIATLASGDPFQAVALATQSREIRKTAADEAEKKGEQDFPRRLSTGLDLSESETTLAQVYRSVGELEEAGAGYRHALALRSEYLGAEHLCVAQAENNLGELDFLVGEYPAALDLYGKSLAVREKALPADHRDLAQSFNNLGSLYQAMAFFPQAKGWFERALENRLKLGPEHPEVADSYHCLASLFKAMGELPRAEQYYEKALAIRRAKLGEGLEVAETETAFAELYLASGDGAHAQKLLEHAHAIRQAKLPADHPDLAESLADLAKVFAASFDLAKAERSAEQAVSIWEKKLGRESPRVASGLSALGEIQFAQGKLPLAQASLREALQIREARFGADHPAVAESLHLLGTLRYAQLDYAGAEPLFRRAVEIRRAKLGAQSPETAASLSYLAALLVATDRSDEALQAFHEAQVISEMLLRSAGSMASEARLATLLRFLRSQEEVVYSLLDEEALAPRAAPLALSIALLRKGRSVDEAAGISQAVYQSLGADDQKRFNDLRILRSQLARQKLSPTAAVSEEGLRKLSEQADGLERELAQRSAAVRSRRALPALDGIVKQTASALPPAHVLVEVVRYHPYRFRAKAGEPRWGAPRYAALVLGAKGEVTSADLGSAEAIDAASKQLLKQIAEAPDRPMAGAAADPAREAAKALEALVVEPIRKSLGQSTGVVLSLDGQLNLVPFWALFDGEKYLIDRFELTYVTAGRICSARPWRSGRARWRCWRGRRS